MKIGLYSVTYRGVWYRGGAEDVFSLPRLVKEEGWEGLELDAERPHAAPMDLSCDDRKRLRDSMGELGLPLCAISPNCDLSSPVPVQREAMISYTRECIKLARDFSQRHNISMVVEVTKRLQAGNARCAEIEPVSGVAGSWKFSGEARE